jgi:hypothetical protein
MRAIHAPNDAFGSAAVVTLAFKPPANTVNMPSASNATTAIISSFIWSFYVPFFRGFLSVFFVFCRIFLVFLAVGFSFLP